MKKYEELQKPYWKRLKYAPTETIEQKELPLEYAVELNRLIEIELEGTIG